MGFDLIAEQRIRQAINDGEFNFDGPGRPVDLDAYFAMPEDVRVGYSILKNANCLPEEVELMKAHADLSARVAAAPDDERAATMRRELRDLEMKLAIARERRLHSERRRGDRTSSAVSR